MRNKEIELSLQIDRHRLDDECVEQPRLYFHYAAELDNARHELDRAKAMLELVDAELDLAIRSDPESFGLTKITESSLRSMIVVQVKHVKAQEKILRAKDNVNILGTAVSALDQKKKSIEGLIQLQLANYFSSPKVPECERERMDEVSKRSIRRKGRKGSE